MLIFFPYLQLISNYVGGILHWKTVVRVTDMEGKMWIDVVETGTQLPLKPQTLTLISTPLGLNAVGITWMSGGYFQVL
jgi:hypothetical protein